MKVVVNRCFGGFSYSLEAARFMAARGNKIAKEEIAEWEARQIRPCKFSFDREWLGNDSDLKRTDPDLVAAVEELGSEKASGAYAKLEVVTIPDGIDWEIDEYDGMERVEEKHRSW